MTSTDETIEQLLLSPISGHEGQCMVCYSPLEYTGITPCGHNDVCGVCHLRLRHLCADTKCPMCKASNTQIVVDKPGKVFEEYEIWGNELGSDFVYKDGIFFPVAYYQEDIQPLFGYYCTHCHEYDGTTPDDNPYEQQQGQQQQQQRKKKPPPLRALQDHLRNKHRLALCQLCVDHKRDFVSQLPRFTPSQLKIHLTKGDGITSGFKGHPVCEFCRPKRFYDLHELHHHLQTQHYKCHVCDKQGLPNQYFRNYDSLQHHFDVQHYACQDPQCLAARFVVFENEIDYRAHQVQVHGHQTGSQKIQLEFRVRRSTNVSEPQSTPSQEDFQYGLDGQAFVPQEVENVAGAPNEEMSHPLHLARTNELRAHAAAVRQARGMEEVGEAFPSLNQSQSTTTTPLRVGWSSQGLRARGVETTREEAFPSLPTASNKKKAATNIKSGSVSGNRQFAAMRNAAAAAPSGTWTGSRPAAVAVASSTGQSSDDNFPSRAAVGGNNTSVARKKAPPPPSSSEDFPSLGGPTTSTRYVAAENLARKKAPSFTSASDFPPPPSLSASKSNVREKVLTKQTAPSKEALDNVLQFPPPPSSASTAQATVQEMKASLGATRYKKLKNLTKEFASNELAPDAYVDHVASLFDSGYADKDFWSFVPSLLASCPNESSAKEARRYMEQLRLDHSKSGGTTVAAAVTSSALGGWTSVSGHGGMSSGSAAPAVARPVASSLTQPVSSGRSNVPIPKKNTTNVWGSGDSAVLRAKEKPGIAQEGPEKSTKPKQQPKASGSKKNKKKQNDELRALAFGN